MKKPKNIPPQPLESSIQRTVVKYLDLQYPTVFKYASQNANMGQFAGMVAKSMGHAPGFPDLFIPYRCQNYSGLFLEFKRSGLKLFKKNGQPYSQHFANQLEVINILKSQGFRVGICQSFEHAKTIIDEYLQDYKTTQFPEYINDDEFLRYSAPL